MFGRVSTAFGTRGRALECCNMTSCCCNHRVLRWTGTVPDRLVLYCKRYNTCYYDVGALDNKDDVGIDDIVITRANFTINL